MFICPPRTKLRPSLVCAGIISLARSGSAVRSIIHPMTQRARASRRALGPMSLRLKPARPPLQPLRVRTSVKHVYCGDVLLGWIRSEGSE